MFDFDQYLGFLAFLTILTITTLALAFTSCKDKANEAETTEAEIVAEILTFRNILPQGAPSSPIISNYVCEKLDKELHKFCKSFNIIYSRYADDLTFSFAFKKLPKHIVKDIYSIIKKHEFKINAQKTRYFYRNRRQVVTGLVVNEKVNVKFTEFTKQITEIEKLTDSNESRLNITIGNGFSNYADLIKKNFAKKSFDVF